MTNAERLKPYYVVSPEYRTGGMYSPPEWGADVVAVEATDEREAVKLGLRKMRADSRCQWLGLGEHPMKVRADLAVCEHGRGHGWEEGDPAVWTDCEDCDAADAVSFYLGFEIAGLWKWHPNTEAGQ